MNTDKLWCMEAECAVLGSIILNPDCLGTVLQILGEKPFFKPEHQLLYENLIEMFLADMSRDLVTLRSRLTEKGQLGKVGGLDYLMKIVDTVPSAANVEYYSGIVRNRKRYRNLVNQTNKIKIVLEDQIMVDDMIDQIQELVLDIEPGKTSDYYILSEHVDRIANLPPDDRAYIKTGFSNIDHLIEGVRGGELIILAGRPSMGKSALMLQFAINMAKTGLSIIIFTLEMTYRGLIERMLLSDDVRDLITLKVIIHEGAQTPESQLAFVKTHKADVVVIDYIQLMSTKKKTENRQQEITTISRKLKRMAIRQDIPVIALSQLNRAVDGREDHRPRMSDLRESGSLEQDADLVMFLYREDYYRKKKDINATPDGTAELIISKNRRGPVGIAELIFLDEQVKFGDKQFHVPESMR